MANETGGEIDFWFRLGTANKTAISNTAINILSTLNALND